MGSINYRAVHAKTLWRKVNSHQSIDAAINGKDGAAGLFGKKARINYETHGDPMYVVVWENGASLGYVVKADPNAIGGIRTATISVSRILDFEHDEQASPAELKRLFD